MKNKGPRQQAIQMNIFTAFLAALKVSRKFSFSSSPSLSLAQQNFENCSEQNNLEHSNNKSKEYADMDPLSCSPEVIHRMLRKLHNTAHT